MVWSRTGWSMIVLVTGGAPTLSLHRSVQRRWSEGYLWYFNKGCKQANLFQIWSDTDTLASGISLYWVQSHVILTVRKKLGINIRLNLNIALHPRIYTQLSEVCQWYCCTVQSGWNDEERGPLPNSSTSLHINRCMHYNHSTLEEEQFNRMTEININTFLYQSCWILSHLHLDVN